MGGDRSGQHQDGGNAPGLTIDIVHQAGDWTTFGDAGAIASACADAVTRSAAWVLAEPATVTLALSADAPIRELNRIWRHKDRATNVLSFPAPLATRDGTRLYLGDVILAAETLAVEARDLGLPPTDHLRHLIVHGLLHLLGYDHEADADAIIMERHEATILATLGVADPHAERDAASPLREKA